MQPRWRSGLRRRWSDATAAAVFYEAFSMPPHYQSANRWELARRAIRLGGREVLWHSRDNLFPALCVESKVDMLRSMRFG